LKFLYLIDLLKELSGLCFVSLIMTVICSIVYDLFGTEIQIYEDHIYIYPDKPDKLFYKDLIFVELLKGIYKKKSYGLIKLYNDKGLQRVIILSKNISMDKIKKLLRQKGVKFISKSDDT